MLRLLRWLEAFGALLLFAMMAITFVDVAGRYLIGRPLTGSTEIIRVLLAVSVASILPSVTWHGAHITVSLFETAAATGVERARRAAVAALSALTFAAVAWLLWGHALDTAANRDVIGYLQLPVAPMVHVVSALCGVTALVFATLAFAAVRGHPR